MFTISLNKYSHVLVITITFQAITITIAFSIGTILK